jgi:LPXTG-motif cell wall-anchored protein
MNDTTGSVSSTGSSSLPGTGSDMPLLGLLGVVSLAGALALRRLR